MKTMSPGTWAGRTASGQAAHSWPGISTLWRRGCTTNDRIRYSGTRFRLDEGLRQGSAILDQIGFYFNPLSGERINVGLKRLVAGKGDPDLMCSRGN